MRVASVTEIKTDHWGGTRDYPRPGTRARQVYDFLRLHRGRTVDTRPLWREMMMPSHKGEFGSILSRLQDDYGCDIRRVKNGHYILAGEWFGSHYTDYVAQAIDEAIRGAP